MELKHKGLILCLILAVGFAVRIIGIDFGLPFLYHNDERFVVNYALAYGCGDLNPHFFRLPPLLSYALFFLYGLFYLAGLFLGAFKSVADFGYLYLNDPTTFFLIGRVFCGLLFGLLSILFLYYLARDIFSERVGLLAALFLSLNFLHVRDSHYLYFDIPLVFFIILFFILLYRIFEKDRFRDYLLCGVVLGIATSVKYSAVILGVPLVLVILRNKIRFNDTPGVFFKKALAMGFLYLFTLFITNPFMFLDYRFFIYDVSRMPFHKQEFWYHLRVSLLGSCGLVMCLVSALGMIMAVLKKNAFSIILIVFVAAYYLVVARVSQSAERYIFPIIPPVLVFAAFYADHIIAKLRSFKVRSAAAGAVCAALLMPSMVKIYYCDRLFLAEDTRTKSYRWVKENIPANAKIALDATSVVYPSLEQSKEFIAEGIEAYKRRKFSRPIRRPEGAFDYKTKLAMDNPRYTEKTYRIYYLKKALERKGFLLSSYPEIELDADRLRENEIEYVIVSALLISGPGRDFLPELEKHAEAVKEFSPYKEGVDRMKPRELSRVQAAAFTYKELRDRKSFGPVIRIYRLK